MFESYGTGEGLDCWNWPGLRKADVGVDSLGVDKVSSQMMMSSAQTSCLDPDFQVTQNPLLNTGPGTQQLLFYISWLNAKYCPSGHTFPPLGSWIARHQLPEFIFCLESVHHTHSQLLLKGALDVFLISVLSPWSIVPHFLVIRMLGLCLTILSLAPCLLWKGGPINR